MLWKWAFRGDEAICAIIGAHSHTSIIHNNMNYFKTILIGLRDVHYGENGEGVKNNNEDVDLDLGQPLLERWTVSL